MAADGQCSLPASWRPVTLTHVEYPAGDLSGHVLAYLSLSPVFVIVGFVTLIIFKRELHTISFLGGLALNEGVNWLIKHVIQEPRPCGGPHTAVGTKYGMPSSHSQFMWFFSIYSFLFLYLRMHQTNNARFLDLLWRHVLSLGLLTVAFLVSYSRYSGRGRPPSPPCPHPLRSGWILGPHGGPEPWSLWAGPGRGPPASQVKRPGLQLPLATQSLLSTLSGARGPGVSHLLPCPETDKLPSSRAGRAPAMPSLHLCSVGG
ncbi:dolichyldiphosphatase 1 isoform X4 [Ovis aries]|uniref:dolichyldiphosphatase 1 isoform X4 n=1 Tax=Ovis aries TaxID=9940 RepID=UPI0029526968|nr:dolichyldiphosphatase 1 isoform X4 [Ovis aries]